MCNFFPVLRLSRLSLIGQTVEVDESIWSVYICIYILYEGHSCDICGVYSIYIYIYDMEYIVAMYVEYIVDTEKSFWNHINSNQNQIVFTIFRLIWNTNGHVRFCFKSIGKFREIREIFSKSY